MTHKIFQTRYFRRIWSKVNKHNWFTWLKQAKPRCLANAWAKAVYFPIGYFLSLDLPLQIVFLGTRVMPHNFYDSKGHIIVMPCEIYHWPEGLNSPTRRLILHGARHQDRGTWNYQAYQYHKSLQQWVELVFMRKSVTSESLTTKIVAFIYYFLYNLYLSYHIPSTQTFSGLTYQSYPSVQPR